MSKLVTVSKGMVKESLHLQEALSFSTKKFSSHSWQVRFWTGPNTLHTSMLLQFVQWAIVSLQAWSAESTLLFWQFIFKGGVHLQVMYTDVINCLFSAVDNLL